MSSLSSAPFLRLVPQSKVSHFLEAARGQQFAALGRHNVKIWLSPFITEITVSEWCNSASPTVNCNFTADNSYPRSWRCQASRVFSHSISPPCTAIFDYQPCHDPEFESKHVTATALPWQSRRSWQRKVHFPGFLALPEIFQASGHLIPGPRIPFPEKRN